MGRRRSMGKAFRFFLPHRRAHCFADHPIIGRMEEALLQFKDIAK